MTTSSDQSVRQIVVEHPEAITVLERYGIDYRCAGESTLAEVCNQRDLDPTLVLEALGRQQQDASTFELKWQNVPFKEIIEFIVKHHHAIAREQLNLIRTLAPKVERQHGNKHPELFQISEALAAISTELSFHLFWEETVLFPYILQLDTGQEPKSPPTCTCGQEPADHALTDHKHTGNELRLLRELSNNYHPPADACTSYRALYRALEDFDRDLSEHIHLENYILFPRVLEHSRVGDESIPRKLTVIEKQLERGSRRHGTGSAKFRWAGIWRRGRISRGDVETEFASFADSDDDGMVVGRHFDGIVIFIWIFMALFALAAIGAIAIYTRHSKEHRNPVSHESVAPTTQSQ